MLVMRRKRLPSSEIRPVGESPVHLFASVPSLERERLPLVEPPDDEAGAAGRHPDVRAIRARVRHLGPPEWSRARRIPVEDEPLRYMEKDVLVRQEHRIGEQAGQRRGARLRSVTRCYVGGGARADLPDALARRVRDPAQAVDARRARQPDLPAHDGGIVRLAVDEEQACVDLMG
jgi:hypothetical protein